MEVGILAEIEYPSDYPGIEPRTPAAREARSASCPLLHSLHVRFHTHTGHTNPSVFKMI